MYLPKHSNITGRTISIYFFYILLVFVSFRIVVFWLKMKVKKNIKTTFITAILWVLFLRNFYAIFHNISLSFNLLAEVYTTWSEDLLWCKTDIQ